ncbi:MULTISPECIES: TetR/AcrR family transcriptional regulator [Niastella]|uniref:TetR/AcrR family transcriptional regulator n=1 Tax=Niastella soli TaxID=2821487 RepID=A0ABS3Z233_9BACT|nr:TetR/AcrR family transcriptional regulator [Niastella soli]MBO9204227.1 TetR/AcrR family transcriptional regulator [Niastella soli]
MSNSQDLKDPFREEILNGARDLFQRFGFKKTTMEDIARQVGKSKSALYYYYKTKEEIFEAVVLNDIVASQTTVAEAVKKEGSATSRFRILVTTLLEDVKQKANKFGIFKADLYENHFLFDSIIKKRDSFIEDLLKDILILGISQHEVKVMSTAEMSLWATMINVTLKATASKIFLEENFQLSPTQLTFIADTFFNGVKA